jgi:CRP-like cAMP-binding protein
MNEISNEGLLRHIGLGRDLNDDLIGQLASIAAQVLVARGATIFRENQRHPLVYWIIDGVVKLEMSTSHAGPKAVLTVGTGDLLAWSALLGNQRMTTTAIASTDGQLIGFDSDRVRQLCDDSYEIGYRFLQSLAEALSRRLVATRLQLFDLFE